MKKVNEKDMNEARNMGMTAGQLKGYRSMLEGHNIFLTGDAGTGKSFLLNNYIDYCNKKGYNIMVMAPTGIAALNIGGSTIHRVFHIGASPLVVRNISDVKVPDEVKSADIIVIDEISMCRIDLFEYVMSAIIKENKSRESMHYEPIQLIVCGDFFQLPPVITDKDKKVLDQYYNRDIGKGFAFQSACWKMMNFVSVVLTDVVRQSDKSFSSILNRVRFGDQSILYQISRDSSKVYIKDAINLTFRNSEVNKMNEDKLSEIQEPIMHYYSNSLGDVRLSDKPTLDDLMLKDGARVMILINDKDGKFSNGTFATIVKCLTSDVLVEIDGTGEVVRIEPYTWEINSYAIKGSKLSTNVVGKFTQLPLKLAYAITIHKSQGQTYEKMNLNPFCVECGQLYVALSRVKSLENLHLTKPLYKDFRGSKEVLQKFIIR